MSSLLKLDGVSNDVSSLAASNALAALAVFLAAALLVARWLHRSDRIERRSTGLWFAGSIRKQSVRSEHRALRPSRCRLDRDIEAGGSVLAVAEWTVAAHRIDPGSHRSRRERCRRSGGQPAGGSSWRRDPATFFSLRRCVFTVWDTEGVGFRRASGRDCAEFIDG
jgi:hypothetical protein